MTSLKERALAKDSGFRFKETTVPEWDNAKVMLREPSGEGWLRWQEIVRSGNDDEEISVSERAHRNLCADVVLFMDVLCDTDKQPIFGPEDVEQVRAIYGPIHARLLKQGLDLISTADDAREKSLPPA
ncbi:phage tail protein [Superficieibacter electus]|uniref:Phage tail protein n=1 Tax=Superficieibacter electus TaxID=2022662 RepID=A0A2P5GP12_9ENTR|nr:phage tail assembly chaperone [Superficieibacter electus]POP44926.1 phage tail protein [Superficieibacter electus]POP48313.1 phage tail protein [Superficieibacter electus]